VDSLKQSKGMFVYFAAGVPKGHEIVQAGINPNPKITQISPAKGSDAGGIIHATVAGVGKNTPVMGLEGLQFVNAKNQILCSAMKIDAYGKVQCTTKKDFAVKVLE
jgi:hypothetical protein